MNKFQKSQAEKILASYVSQENDLEKGGKRAFIGEVRNYSGQDWVKHHDGWVLVHPSGKHLLERTGGKREPASKEHIDHARKHLGQDILKEATKDTIREEIKEDQKLTSPITVTDTLHPKIQSIKEKIERVAKEYKGPLSQDELKENLAKHAIDKYIVDIYHTNYKEGDDYQEIYDRLGPTIYKELGIEHEKYNPSLVSISEPTVEEVKDAIPEEVVPQKLTPMAQRFLDAVRVADNNIQLNELTVEATPKGNWAIYREGEGKLMTLRSDLLDSDTIREYGLEYHDTYEDEPVEDRNEGKEEFIEIERAPSKEEFVHIERIPSSKEELDYIDNILPEEKDIDRAKGIDSDAKASSMANKINDREKLVRRAKAVAMHKPEFFGAFENSLLASGFHHDQIDKIKGSSESSNTWVPKQRTTPIDKMGRSGRSYGGRRNSPILPLGSINLKTGDSKYFNVFDTWGEDTTYEVYEVRGDYDYKSGKEGKPKYKLVATSGKRPIHDVGDSNSFEHDQTFAPMFSGKVVDYAVGASELKKIASVYGNSLYGYTYK